MTRAAVKLESGWEELLGNGSADMPERERRTRWATWLRLVRDEGKKEQAIFWSDAKECCWGCVHRRGGWCTNMGLPCTVNPILTMRHDVPGMACMGGGFTPKQLSLALPSNAWLRGAQRSGASLGARS